MRVQIVSETARHPAGTMTEAENLPEIRGHILVVDDERTFRTLHRTILAKKFDVITAESGTECLDLCTTCMPDLILLDIEMPDMNGIDVCRKLRKTSNVPVIFATGHHSMEEHMSAYDAGANDIIVKPVSSEILLRKVTLAVQQHHQTRHLNQEKDDLQRMAMSFLSDIGQSGGLLNFMRASLVCRSHQDLAQKLIETTRDMGLECSVLIRHEGGPTVLTPRGAPNSLEQAILEQAAELGRIFQFRSRLVVNYSRVSLIVANMPDEHEDGDRAGRIRDNMAILTETTEAMCENVDMRLESMARAERMQIALGGAVQAIENLRTRTLSLQGDTRLLLQQLVDEIEKSYSWLDTSQAQESALSSIMDSMVQRILALLTERGDLDSQFDEILVALNGNPDTAIEMF